LILTIIFALILCELLIVAWIDYQTEKISNKWVVLNAVASVILHASIRNLYPLSWEVLLFPVGFIVIGFFLYLLNIMGAGDSKFLASLFLIVPLEFHLLFFSKLIISTIVVGSVLLIIRFVKHGPQLKAYFLSHYWQGIKTTLKSRFSYAPVIFLAWIILGINIWN
jgi:prepilin peptidase CpaA